MDQRKMLAIIEFNNNQYKVVPGQIISLPGSSFDQNDKKIIFDHVLLANNDQEILVGQPKVEGASVEGEVIEKARSKKVRVFKFRAKKRYKRTSSQRQNLTRVKIDKIIIK